MKDCKMKDYGFVRVAAAVPVVSLADPAENAAKICELIDRAEEKKGLACRVSGTVRDGI